MPKCGECWTDVDTGDRYCKSCGNPLPGEGVGQTRIVSPAARSDSVHQFHERGVGQPSGCPPAEVHNTTPMFIGAAVLILFGFLFLVTAPNLIILLLGIAEIALGVWLLVQATKSHQTPVAR